MSREGCCEVGSYGCSELAFACQSCGHAVFVDKCLVEEVKALREKGVSTIGCCCGHGDAGGYIQVNPESVQAMLSLGYEQLPEGPGEMGKWCFGPKSRCPKEGGE